MGIYTATQERRIASSMAVTLQLMEAFFLGRRCDYSHAYSHDDSNNSTTSLASSRLNLQS